MNNRQPPLIILTGGGTGGHIFPALAVAERVRLLRPDWRFKYIGHPERMEADRAPKAGFDFLPIHFSGLPRGQWLRMAGWACQWLGATAKVMGAFIADRPKAVFSTGGFVTAPVLLAALLLNIPTFVHEPDAMPGLVNRLFGRWATVCTCAFQAAIPRLGSPMHAVVAGNPVRGDIGTLTQAEAQTRLFGAPLSAPCILVMGGSQGAASLNSVVLASHALLHQQFKATILHQTGEKHWPAVQADVAQFTTPAPYYHPMPFIEDIPAALAAADVVVCRSGSITLSELALAAKPALLVPYPHAAANHQWKNAQALVDLGAARAIDDAELNPEQLVSHLAALLAEPLRTSMAQAMRSGCARPDATETIANILMQGVEAPR